MQSLLYHLIRTRCTPSILMVLTTHYTGAAGGEEDEDEGRRPSSHRLECGVQRRVSLALFSLLARLPSPARCPEHIHKEGGPGGEGN